MKETNRKQSTKYIGRHTGLSFTCVRLLPWD